MNIQQSPMWIVKGESECWQRSVQLNREANKSLKRRIDEWFDILLPQHTCSLKLTAMPHVWLRLIEIQLSRLPGDYFVNFTAV